MAHSLQVTFRLKHLLMLVNAWMMRTDRNIYIINLKKLKLTKPGMEMSGVEGDSGHLPPSLLCRCECYCVKPWPCCRQTPSWGPGECTTFWAQHKHGCLPSASVYIRAHRGQARQRGIERFNVYFWMYSLHSERVAVGARQLWRQYVIVARQPDRPKMAELTGHHGRFMQVCTIQPFLQVIFRIQITSQRIFSFWSQLYSERSQFFNQN